MRKRLICMLLAMAVLLSVGAVSACATDDAEMPTTEDEIVLWPVIEPLYDMIDGKNVSVQDSSYTTQTASVSGQGNIIRVWFKNQTARPMTVIVKQVRWYGKPEVLHFSVPAGQGAWREYTGNSNGYTYEITLESNGGDSVIGYLRAVQTFTHYTG